MWCRADSCAVRSSSDAKIPVEFLKNYSIRMSTMVISWTLLDAKQRKNSIGWQVIPFHVQSFLPLMFGLERRECQSAVKHGVFVDWFERIIESFHHHHSLLTFSSWNTLLFIFIVQENNGTCSVSVDDSRMNLLLEVLVDVLQLSKSPGSHYAAEWAVLICISTYIHDFYPKLLNR